MKTEATTNVTTRIRGWKATRNMMCLGQEYVVGETYKLPADVKLGMCETGFHFCQRQRDVLNYYSYGPKFVLLEVEAIGGVVTEGDKSVTDELRVLRVVPREEYEFVEDNVIRFENSSRNWRTYEYDERGNEIRYENSYGYWWTKEYDERGSMIRFEDSDGYWYTWEYDEEGNIIRYEESNGNW